jgi:hypothetical protein
MTLVPSGTSDPARDQHMRSLIVRLILLSEIPASVLAPDGGPGTDVHPSSKRLKGGGMSGQDWWDLYVQSPDRTLKHAEEVLEGLRGPVERPAGETPAQETARKAKRVMELYDDGGWSTNDMARDTGLTVRQVNRVLADVEVGRKLSAREKAREAQVMHIVHSTPGVTVRHVAKVTGIAKSTVQDIMMRRAA